MLMFDDFSTCIMLLASGHIVDAVCAFGVLQCKRVHAHLQDDRVALHYAACNAHVTIVDRLLKGGADINAQGRGNPNAREDLEVSCKTIQPQSSSLSCC